VHTENLLRQARLGNRISLDEVVARTKLPRPIVDMIDQGRFAELPVGIYGRAYVRAFASAAGMDPADALASCSAYLSDAPDPLPGLREILREHTTPSLGDLIVERVRAWCERQPWQGPFGMPVARYAAASVDALLLFVVNAMVLALIANACRVPADVLLRVAGSAVMVICGFTSIAYFVLLAGIAGQTPGMRLCALSAPAPHRPLDLRAIAVRTVEVALGESSILVDWLCTSELPAARESTV
jgi:hypothetical protein